MTDEPRLNKRTKQEFLAFLYSGHSITSASEKVGLDRHKILSHRRKDPVFNQQVEDACETTMEMVEDALYKKALSGNVTAQIFYLVNRSRGKWRQVSKVGTEAGLSTRQSLKNYLGSLSDEELAREIQDALIALERDRREPGSDES